MRFTATVAAVVGAVGVIAAPVKQLAARDPPGIPSASTARSLLSDLTVSSPGSGDGYSRDRFNHWISNDGCTARQTVLGRDGKDVETDDDCQPTSGEWYSPFDDETFSSPSDIDIDHMVPLANASGADSWTDDRREEFANDLSGPQLWAVSSSSNRSKSDSSPDEWAPSNTSFRCIYARAWIKVKSDYDLTITSAESTALDGMLDTC